MMKIRNPWPWACGIVLASAIAVTGHGGATGVVGERMMGMMMLGEQVKLLAPVAGGGSVRPELVREAAEMISMHAGPAMTDLFPEGSLEAPTEARPEIWARWQEFSDLSDRLAGLGEELGAAATSPVPEAKVSQTALVEQLSEWDRLDFAGLMGIAPARASTEPDPIVTASVGSSSPEPAARSVAEIYDDIADTCASCHAAFRR